MDLLHKQFPLKCVVLGCVCVSGLTPSSPDVIPWSPGLIEGGDT